MWTGIDSIYFARQRDGDFCSGRTCFSGMAAVGTRLMPSKLLNFQNTESIVSTGSLVTVRYNLVLVYKFSVSCVGSKIKEHLKSLLSRAYKGFLNIIM